jgi:hypothetical protein
MYLIIQAQRQLFDMKTGIFGYYTAMFFFPLFHVKIVYKEFDTW